MLQMDVRGADEGMDTRTLRVLDGLPAGADVALGATCQSTDDRPLHLTRDALHRREITGAAGGETGFDDVHAQTRQLMSDVQLLRGVEAAAR